MECQIPIFAFTASCMCGHTCSVLGCTIALYAPGLMQGIPWVIHIVSARFEAWVEEATWSCRGRRVASSNCRNRSLQIRELPVVCWDSNPRLELACKEKYIISGSHTEFQLLKSLPICILSLFKAKYVQENMLDPNWLRLHTAMSIDVHLHYSLNNDILH